MYWHICYCFLIFSEAGLQFLLGYIFGDIFHRDREIRGTDRLFLDFGLLALLSFLQDEEQDQPDNTNPKANPTLDKVGIFVGGCWV